MNTNKVEIIREVTKIILRNAKPNRIFLYGSEASGESKAGSDIDIAFDDENKPDIYLIKEEIEKLSTLVKIDVINLKNADKRFVERVKSTGKVLYSSTKELRAEDGLYNFSNSLKKFIEVVDGEDIFKEKGFYDVYLDILVKRFEFTYEMAWKALKRYLEFLGIEAKAPRTVFKEAFSQEIIHEEDVWLDMIEQRNLTSHIYDEFQIKDLLNKKENYKNAFIQLKEKIESDLSAVN